MLRAWPVLSKADSLRHYSILLLAGSVLLAGCGSKQAAVSQTEDTAASLVQMMELNQKNAFTHQDDWYGTSYEIFPYSFADSDGDGIGDLQGIDEKLDYLNDGDDSTYEDLSVDAIWLTPVCKAVSYHKYDITDYEAIDPDFGTMDDYDKLVQDCHERGMKVIFDLVLNHTSDEHPWFVQACDYLKKENPEAIDTSVCPYAAYYNFTRQSAAGYTQIEGTDWYYESRFWSGMPDLNLDSEAVRNEIQNIVQFWLDHGVDGFRLDAVTSYYTGRDDLNIAFLNWLETLVKGLKSDAYLVGEAWTNKDLYASYYASGIDSLFDFAYSGADGIIASTLKGKYTPAQFGSSLASEEALYASYNKNCISAPFYTNHDMNRSACFYAGDDGTKVKLAGALNLLMQGNAFVYYGEELGMKGSFKDENRRAPMYWSKDTDAEYMCSGPADMDDVEMKFDSLAEQKDDPLSVYSFYREAIHLRNMFPQIARGETAADSERSDENVLVMTKTWQDSSIEIAVNLSDADQSVSLSGDSYNTLAGVLNTSEDEVTVSDEELNLPAGSIAILKKENGNV